MSNLLRFWVRELGRPPVATPLAAGFCRTEWRHGENFGGWTADARRILQRVGLGECWVEPLGADSPDLHRLFLAGRSAAKLGAWLVEILVVSPTLDETSFPRDSPMLRVAPLFRDGIGVYKPDESKACRYVGFADVHAYVDAVCADDPTMLASATAALRASQLQEEGRVPAAGRFDRVIGFMKRLPDGAWSFVFELVSILPDLD